MSIEENIKVDEENIAAWSSGDPDRAVRIFTDDAVWSDVNSPVPMRDKAAMRGYVQAWFTAFPDMKARVVNRVVTEDQVASEIEFDGTNTGSLQFSAAGPAIPPTGKKVHGRGVYFMRIRGGKVSEIHTYPDVMGMMAQLGLMPGA